MVPRILVVEEFGTLLKIQDLFVKYWPSLKHIKYISNTENVEEVIINLKPDLLFINLDYTKQSGIELMQNFYSTPIKIVISSKFDHFAYDALKYGAIDYILTPWSKESLTSAKERYYKTTLHRTLNYRLEHKKEGESYSTRQHLVVNNSDSKDIISLNQIIYLESFGNYVKIYLLNSKIKLVHNTLHYYEKVLPKNQFFRVHKSFVVNLNCIDSVDKGRGGELHLKNGNKLPIATRRKTKFSSLLNQIHLPSE